MFVADGSIVDLCDPVCPRGVLLGINLPILLAILRHELYFAVENLGNVCSDIVLLKDTTGDDN